MQAGRFFNPKHFVNSLSLFNAQEKVGSDTPQKEKEDVSDFLNPLYIYLWNKIIWKSWQKFAIKEA